MEDKWWKGKSLSAIGEEALQRIKNGEMTIDEVRKIFNLLPLGGACSQLYKKID